jgi:hypothetical protein
LGSSPFARHYSGSRGFFPFLRLLRCFSSPACHYLPYVFRQEHARITTRRFPHSEIPGSKIGQHLPRAYRSRPRPSSALGAKASTVCPSSLDHEEHLCVAAMEFSRCTRTPVRQRENPPRRPVSQNSAAYATVIRCQTLVWLRRSSHRGRRNFQASSSTGRGLHRGARLKSGTTQQTTPHRTGRTPTGSNCSGIP